MTRKEQLLQAFRDADRRGLTAAEMAAVVGSTWRLRLRELAADGCHFREERSRFTRARVFRWTLLWEPPPARDDQAEDPQLALLDPPALPPGCALHGEVDEC